ncbi:uncharacterized protein LACBIDRAFT_323973 [Laccaria bicolor S238N-H82]|uniref:Predicted protein n=1 Tax=Laccaria bicolor (strain S238N-H82 / ATCC MYA-4686) TaxID=486041 RepID=B0D082_LACBS|nr:uncharacterized protein LACBIDRAFT_323973 [Laccaria bicolor S238N-H82]EDR11784.1 predicted protein [Laccaria bicolor S238N-H82]|eukprot:XP_001877681.1 predicted protein [Laccaria bicolor S238N-H82]
MPEDMDAKETDAIPVAESVDIFTSIQIFIPQGWSHSFEIRILSSNKQDTLPNSQHVRETWAKNPVHHNSAAVGHADGTFSQQSLLPNDIYQAISTGTVCGDRSMGTVNCHVPRLQASDRLINLTYEGLHTFPSHYPSAAGIEQRATKVDTVGSVDPSSRRPSVYLDPPRIYFTCLDPINVKTLGGKPPFSMTFGTSRASTQADPVQSTSTPVHSPSDSPWRRTTAALTPSSSSTKTKTIPFTREQPPHQASLIPRPKSSPQTVTTKMPPNTPSPALPKPKDLTHSSSAVPPLSDVESSDVTPTLRRGMERGYALSPMIDPEETMMTALQGCESHSQLEMAHTILLKRLLTAQQTVSKYEAQYQNTSDMPSSPVSTAPELYDELEQLDGVDSHMRFMLQRIPRHRGHLTLTAQEGVYQGLGWDVIHPMPPIPSDVESQSQEPQPFASSEPDTSLQSKVEGKKKVEWGDLPPWFDKSSSVEQGRDNEEGLEPSFGFHTPFKPGTKFFNASNGSGASALFSTPGTMPMTDVTVGLATPSFTQFADNVRTVPVVEQSQQALVHSKNVPSDRNSCNDPSQLRSNNSAPFKGGPPPDDGPPGGGGGSGGGRGSGASNNDYNASHSGGHYHPGGGGGNPGGGGGGGGGGPPFSGNQTGPPAPYGNIPASIKTELKVEQLLEWDGNHWMAIDYFWEVQQLAHLGGWIPEALGYWLWFRLKDKSPVKSWFITLPLTYQTYMRSHYLKFLKGIKDGYLGHRWQLKMNNYYNSQQFRERGHERESPSEFIVRRIVYTHMLLSISGGPLEVFYIMRKAPISWGPILLMSSIKDSSDLYSRVTEHEEALLEAYRVSRGGQTPSIDNIVSQLRQMGVISDKDRATPSYNNSNSNSYQRRANLAEYSNANQSAEEEVPPTAISTALPTAFKDLSSNDYILREAYQVLKQRQRPPPPGGYPFPKNDHVTTKMGRLPPSPCKCWGSSNHWDRECPDYDTSLEKAKRSANVAELWPENEIEKTYATAYSVLLNERLSETTINQPLSEDSLAQQGFKSASSLSQVTVEEASKPGEASVKSERTTIEEVEDKDWLAYHAKPKSTQSPPAQESTEALPESSESPPPIPETKVRLKKRRFTPAGSSAVGVSVVAAQGWTSDWTPVRTLP